MPRVTKTGSPEPDDEDFTAGPDPFDPAAQMVSGIPDVDIEAVLTAVPVRKPKRDEYFRVRPGPGYRVDMWLYERESETGERETYMIAPAVRKVLEDELRLVRLFTAVNRHGITFLWPVKMATGAGDRFQRIMDTALMAAEKALLRRLDPHVVGAQARRLHPRVRPG
jgi:hypothetical protein